MAVAASPSIEFYSNDTLTFGGTAILTITLPPGQSYRLRSITAVGTNAGTTVTVASGATTYLLNGAVGNATVTIPITVNTATPASTITVTCTGAGTITSTRLNLVGATGAPLTSTVT